MAIGKNKKKIKGTSSKGKGRREDALDRKEVYEVRVPALFTNRMAGKTIINRQSGNHVPSQALKGRVFTISLGDLNEKSEEKDFIKMSLVAEEVQGKNVLCNFYGMSVTRDKLMSLVRKWHTKVEAYADIKTADNYTIRMFCVGFTKSMPNQVAKTSYAQRSQAHAIRAKMREIMERVASKNTLKGVMQHVITDAIGRDVEKACKSIYPLENVLVRKVKVVKAPKFDLTRLMEVQGDIGEDAGQPVRQAEEGKVPELAGAGGRL